MHSDQYLFQIHFEGHLKELRTAGCTCHMFRIKPASEPCCIFFFHYMFCLLPLLCPYARLWWQPCCSSTPKPGLVPWCVLEKPSPEQVGDPPVLLAHPAPDASITPGWIPQPVSEDPVLAGVQCPMDGLPHLTRTLKVVPPPCSGHPQPIQGIYLNPCHACPIQGLCPCARLQRKT